MWCCSRPMACRRCILTRTAKSRPAPQARLRSHWQPAPVRVRFPRARWGASIGGRIANGSFVRWRLHLRSERGGSDAAASAGAFVEQFRSDDVARHFGGHRGKGSRCLRPERRLRPAYRRSRRCNAVLSARIRTTYRPRYDASRRIRMAVGFLSSPRQRRRSRAFRALPLHDRETA